MALMSLFLYSQAVQIALLQTAECGRCIAQPVHVSLLMRAPAAATVAEVLCATVALLLALPILCVCRALKRQLDQQDVRSPKIQQPKKEVNKRACFARNPSTGRGIV